MLNVANNPFSCVFLLSVVAPFLGLSVKYFTLVSADVTFKYSFL
jgi:hypothetical protein